MARVSKSTIIGVLVLVIVAAPFVAHAVPQTVGADHSYVVVSGSMEPAIDAASVVWVKDAPTSSIEEGDVITFRNRDSGPPTTHRVVEVYGDGRFITKGDANAAPDGDPVEPGRVLGEVAFSIPLIGYFVLFAQTRLGMFLVIVLPFALLVANELWVRYERAQADETNT